MLNGCPYITPANKKNIKDRIREIATCQYRQPGNFVISVFLGDLQAQAVEKFGFTWDEVEAIEIQAYKEEEEKELRRAS